MKNIFLVLCVSLLFSCTNSNRIILLEIEDASGIFNDTEVVFKGQKVGKINEIKITGNKIIAELLIQKNFTIFTNSEFFIISKDILGSKAIEIINPDKGEKYNFNNLDTFICKTKPAQYELLFKDIINTSKAIMDTIVIYDSIK